MNLTVNGQIKCSNGHAAGIIGENNNWTLIHNCTVSATIEGGNCIGGFSVGSGGTLKIENCLFDGKINGGDDCGGFVAWGTDTLVLRNCVFDPVSGSSIKSGATFANKAYDTLDNCVYYTALGTPQGDQAPEVYQNMVSSAKKLTVGNFKVKAKKNRQAAVTWKKNIKVDGFQIKYSTDKKFKKSVKTIIIDKSNAKKILKKLKPGKKLYVKIRAYKNIKNPASGKKTTVYGVWSKVKSIKVKSVKAK